MWSAHLFLKKWANPGLFFVYFCSLLVTISKQIEKNHRWCAWDSNPGPQDGGRRRNYGAMAATLECSSYNIFYPIHWQLQSVKMLCAFKKSKFSVS